MAYIYSEVLSIAALAAFMIVECQEQYVNERSRKCSKKLAFTVIQRERQKTYSFHKKNIKSPGNKEKPPRFGTFACLHCMVTTLNILIRGFQRRT